MHLYRSKKFVGLEFLGLNFFPLKEGDKHQGFKTKISSHNDFNLLC